jgi:flagellar hook-basal body complex protein FliE
MITLTSPVNPATSPSPVGLPTGPSAAHPGQGGFGSLLEIARHGVDEVATLQADATRKSEALVLGETDDVAGVLSAVEKGELAFKTLLAIRTKLMNALDEVRNMPV